MKFCLGLILCFVSVVFAKRYEPNWDSLDTRPLPTWYDDAKFGIFIHWGVFSVPGFMSEWFWWYWKGIHYKSIVEFMENNYPPHFTYADFAHMFRAEFYNPDQWVDIFKAAGAKYIVLTSKHHEGFTNWPSNVSFNWNSVDVGPNRDLVGELANAVRKKSDIRFGLYHSLLEWFNPLYLKDKENKFKTQYFPLAKTWPELYELVNSYKPDIVWSDGDWESSDTYWNATDFIAWLYNDSPVRDHVVTNDRWGNNDIACHHGDIYTCHDQYNPGVLQKHKWENCKKLDKYSWGYRRNTVVRDYCTMEEILKELITTVSCGGNLLLNIGPTSDGMIAPVMEERLRQIGDWLRVNGEAIYATRPWSYQNDTVANNVWYTSKKTEAGVSVYALLLEWPKPDHEGRLSLTLGAPTPSKDTVVTLLGYPYTIPWHSTGQQGMLLAIPPITFTDMPCQWAWAFRLDNLSN